MGDIVSSVVFPRVKLTYNTSHQSLVWYSSENAGHIPAILLLPKQLRAPCVGDGDKRTCGSTAKLGHMAALCVVFFHANMCDIGETVDFLRIIQEDVCSGDAVVLAPEYPGYGLLGDFEASPKSIDSIARATWRFCQNFLGFSAGQVILWGHSVGTGPATKLAHSVAEGLAITDASCSRNSVSGNLFQSAWGLLRESVGGRSVSREADKEALRRPEDDVERNVSRDESPDRKSSLRNLDLDSAGKSIGALVLMAPYISIAEVVKAHAGYLASSIASAMWENSQMLSNPILRDVPLCVVHPKEDEVVPLSHGQEVLRCASTCKKVGIWIPEEGHNFDYNGRYLEHVREFLEEHVESLQHVEKADLSASAG